MKTSLFHRCLFSVILLPLCAYSADIFSPEPTSDTVRSESPFFPRTGTSRRWQQVYGAADFGALANGGGIVTAVSFSGNVPFGGTLSNVQIYLSATVAAPDSLSPVFAENTGFNETLVHGGALVMRASSSGYNWRIDLTTPFYYNPDLGNLLIDIKQYGPYGIPPVPPFYGIDATISPDDRVSVVVASDVNSLQGGTSTGGLLTMFTVTPVPEPSTIAFVSAGLIILFLRGRIPNE